MENFFNDPKFQEYVFEGKHKKYWTDYLLNHPENLEEFKGAESLVKSIKFKKHEVPPEKYQQYLSRYKKAIHTDPSLIKQADQSQKNDQLNYFLKIAAVITIIVSSFAAFLYYNFQASYPTNDLQSIDANMIIKSIPKGMKSSVTLMDGTKVKLNSESTLQFPEEFSAETRYVLLKGEAYFEIASDTTRPFLIQCNDMSITVLGTTFNVRTYDDEVKASVAVKSGKVMVSSRVDGKELTHVLEKGEMISMNKPGMEIEKSTFDPEAMFGWTDGKIVFTDADVLEIVNRLERWYNVEIEMDMKRKITRGYTGKFSNVALENILQGIGFSLGFRYEIDEKKVRIFD